MFCFNNIIYISIVNILPYLMKIKNITNKKNWGDFQMSLGNKIWRFGIYDNETLLAVALTIKHTARRASYLIVPHGPVITEHETHNIEQVLKVLVEKLKILTKEERTDFVRISPIIERTYENRQIFKNLGFRRAPLHSHPESSWKLNIAASEDELMRGIRKTTRYLIRQAESNKDIEIFQTFDIKDVEEFNKMHLEVVKKQNFVPFSLEYFKKEFSAFKDDKQIALFMARYKGKLIAASYGIFWSDIAFYHHAALLPEFKKIPASYLLQWSAIKEAKKRGCKIYDFWGYSDPVKNPKHPYSGPTLFKMGFGGYKDEYVETQDIVCGHKYWFNYIIEAIRKIKRGL